MHVVTDPAARTGHSIVNKGAIIDSSIAAKAFRINPDPLNGS